MSAIVINNIEHELPANLTLAQWKQLVPYTAQWKKLIAMAFDVDDELLQDMDIEAQQIGAAIVHQILYPAERETNTDGVISFKELTLGQFIDLEYHIAADVKKQIVEIADILFEEKITDETPISKIWGAFQSYMNYRVLLYKQYEKLFAVDDVEDEVVEYKQRNPQDSARGWYNTVMYMADDDILKANQIVDHPIVTGKQFFVLLI